MGWSEKEMKKVESHRRLMRVLVMAEREREREVEKKAIQSSTWLAVKACQLEP